MSPITTEIQFLELYWVKNDGTEFTACYPKDKAEIMLNKHLLPLKDSGTIRDAGFKTN
jgi:hypothetical protein